MHFRRIYLLGNGSSLKETPLHLLEGKQVMGVNKIHKMRLPFPLTHYVKIDYSAFDPDDWKEEVLVHVQAGETCLLWDAFRNGADPADGNYEYIYDGIGEYPNVRYISRCKHHYARTADWHPLCTGLNSIVTMVLWAVELGYDEIVLVGCDGRYGDPKTDHFVDDYYKQVDGTYKERNNLNLQMAHDFIKAHCPIPILDATVNGHLTQYKKVKLEDLK